MSDEKVQVIPAAPGWYGMRMRFEGPRHHPDLLKTPVIGWRVYGAEVTPIFLQKCEPPLEQWPSEWGLLNPEGDVFPVPFASYDPDIGALGLSPMPYENWHAAEVKIYQTNKQQQEPDLM